MSAGKRVHNNPRAFLSKVPLPLNHVNEEIRFVRFSMGKERTDANESKYDMLLRTSVFLLHRKLLKMGLAVLH